jgi:uncharacterized membrane protein
VVFAAAAVRITRVVVVPQGNCAEVIASEVPWAATFAMHWVVCASAGEANVANPSDSIAMVPRIFARVRRVIENQGLRAELVESAQIDYHGDSIRH